jgi:hypothetical protein
MTMRFTQPLTEMSIRNLPEGKRRSARKANKLSVICEAYCLENVGSSTTHKPVGLYGLLQGKLYFIACLLRDVTNSITYKGDYIS